MKPFSISGILRLAILFFAGFVLLCCDAPNFDDERIQVVNNVFLDQQEVNFSAARIQITGPVSITGPNSHVSVSLVLSTDENFSNSQPLNTNVLNIQLLFKNKEVSFPNFSLPNGNYQVFKPSLLDQEHQNEELEKQDLLAFPTLLIQYLGNDNYMEVFFGKEGLINLQFDVQNDLVRISHNWETKEGPKISGLSTLPINLTAFRN